MAETKPPKVFISYAWEDELKTWVLGFATRLRSDGINAILDQWETVPGDQLTQFMEKSVRESDYVVFVCTPTYKRKSDRRRGGVGYEGSIITGEVFQKNNHRKFIPVLRKGKWVSAAPSWATSKLFIDFRGGGIPRETGFDITVASEVMAILALTTSLQDMRKRFGRIVVGLTHDKKPVTAEEIGAAGVIVHGGHVTADASEAEGFLRWVKAMDALDMKVPVLLENTAGGDHAMARHFGTIAGLWDHIGDSGIGFCLDTYHAHAAGEELISAAERILAITGRIDLVHCNDSKDGLGSGRDRHELLGQGNWSAWPW